MKKGLVIINESHSLMPDQRRVLDSEIGEGSWSTLLVPEAGWTLDEIRNVYVSIAESAPERLAEDEVGGLHVVFASPVPALLNYIAQLAGAETRLLTCWVLHNDHRVAKEVPDGRGGVRIVHSIAPTGWRLA